MRIHISHVLLLLFALALAACGSGSGTPSDPDGPPDPEPKPETECVDGGGPEVTVAGTVAYERLVLTSAGLGPALEVRPARFVDVRVRAVGGGDCYGESSTDENGAFAFAARPPDGAEIEVWAYSRTTNDPLRFVTVHEGLPPAMDIHTDANAFGYPSASFPAGSVTPVELTVPYNPGTLSRPSIGFGSLDVLVTCAEAIRLATGTPPPLCHAYTRLGNNGATGTSFYALNARALTLLGGASGNLDGSDTDYFDDAVIAHEFGHFIEFNLAHTLTRGGAHSGQALEPGFSWSEGQATGFGSLLRRTHEYIDTWGTSGGLLLSASVENWMPQTVRGIGGEETVAELVYDLGDGANGVTDLDGDIAALALGDLYDTFFAFDRDADAPYVGLFLERLVSGGALASGDLDALLRTPENQEISWPLSGDDVWPERLSLPANVSGEVDSTTGNRCRGLEASRWYRFTLTSSASILFDLEIFGIAPSGDNLDLYLLDMRGVVLLQSTRSGDADEGVGPVILDPGHFLVRVEANCGGSGNHAGFALRVAE